MVKTKRNANIGKTLTTEYGTIEIIGYEGPWRLEVYRPFAVAANEPWNKEIKERRMCAGPLDDTNTFRMTRSYNAACSCCYLGIPHTAARHDRDVEEHQARTGYAIGSGS